MTGFHNLETTGVPYSVKFIAMKPNYMDALATYRLIRNSFPSARFIVSGYQLMGEAVTNTADVAERHSRVGAHIEEVLDEARDDGNFIPVFMFPMCQVDPMYWDVFGVGVWREEVIAPDSTEISHSTELNYEQKPEPCTECKLQFRCTWAWRNYVAEFGTDELSPVL